MAYAGIHVVVVYESTQPQIYEDCRLAVQKVYTGTQYKYRYCTEYGYSYWHVLQYLYVHKSYGTSTYCIRYTVPVLVSNTVSAIVRYEYRYSSTL